MKNKRTLKKFFSFLNKKKIIEISNTKENIQENIDVDTPILTVSFFDDVNTKTIYDRCMILSRKNNAHINLYYGPINLIINFNTSYNEFISAINNRMKLFEVSNKKAQNDYNNDLKMRSKIDEYDKEKKDERALKATMALELTKSFMMMKTYGGLNGDIIDNFDEERAVTISCKMTNLLYENFPVFRKDEL